jgi:hypothetical protein
MICFAGWRRVVVCFVFSLGLASNCLFAQLSTSDHLADPGFWPTKAGTPREQYAGASTCASCHGKISATQRSTPMSATAVRAADASILHSHPSLNFAVGTYHYEIKTSGKQPNYTVTNGNRSLSASLLWAFGTGLVGQSYLFKKEDGKFYEARVTYFETLHDLGFTPDRALAAPKNIEEAMYRPVDVAEAERCLACHTTAWLTNGHIDEKNLVPGIQCEACHGPGAFHTSDMEAAQISGLAFAGEQRIYSPGKLSPNDSVDFCGSCHTTWWDVKLSGVKGVSNVKSQPYRLESSKCWGKGDARLTCVACHDPHQPLQAETASYDPVCMSCHESAASANSNVHAGMSCTVGKKDCASCHMPKVYVPEMHYNFTDHRIRIAKAGEPYPE